MDQRKGLKQFVQRAKRSLNFEQMLPRLQYGLFIGLTLSAVILVISRLFVFPYYGDVTVISGGAIIIGSLIYIWWKRIKNRDALHRLDAFYPHNELVTALSLKDEKNPLVSSILEKAKKESPSSYERFKNRKKVYWKPKTLIGILLMAITIGVLTVFPSATQQEALVIEKEKDVVKDLEKEVAKIEKKTQSEQTKKQLQELQKKLKETESAEEALREVVKKQKELKLQEQKLKEKENLKEQANGAESNGLSAKEQEQLKELMEMQSQLASTANSTQSSLSKLGKPISFDLQNAIASELGSESSESDDASDSASSNEGESSDQTDQGESQQENNQNSNQQGQGNGQGNSSGSGSGQGQGNGSGSGAGSVSGSGSGSGGSGKGNGSGAGLGQGSRDLLSIPERFGNRNETTADGGPLGGGTAAGEQKGSVPVTKGTVRPYEEVIGQYKDSYLESSDRMQLPKDLQDIVQSYFSSIESNE